MNLFFFATGRIYFKKWVFSRRLRGKGGIKGVVKRGEAVGDRTGPEGERVGKNEGKRVGGKGLESIPKKKVKKTRVTLILVHFDLGTL